MASKPSAVTRTAGLSANGDFSLEASWSEAVARLEASLGSLEELCTTDWSYLSSICALCRVEDQPWDLLLHALHVPRLLCSTISNMLTDAYCLHDPMFEQLITVVMAAANLIRAAHQDAQMQLQQPDHRASLHWHTCSVLSSQIEHSGLLEQLPLVLADVTEAITAASSAEEPVDVDSSSSSSSSSKRDRLALLGLPLLQLFANMALVWLGPITSADVAAPTVAAVLRLSLVALSSSSCSVHVPNMLCWISATVIVQLTDPVAAAADSAMPLVTATPDFLQAVVLVLAIQSHWLLQPAFPASICSNRSSSSRNSSLEPAIKSDSLENDVLSSSSANSTYSSVPLTTSSSMPLPDSSSGSSSSSSTRVDSASSDGSKLGSSRPASWLFRNVSSYWAVGMDTAPSRDQQQQPQQQPQQQQPHRALLPPHALLLDSLGLQQHKLDELVEVVYSEGDRQTRERDIQLRLHMYVQLSQQMRAASKRRQHYQVVDEVREVLPWLLLLPVSVLHMAEHCPSQYDLVAGAAAAAREALCWWPMLRKPGLTTHPTLSPALLVQELLQLLVQTIQKVLQQPDMPNCKTAAAHPGSMQNPQQHTKASALDALADAVSALSSACVECDAQGDLTAWQQSSQPLAEAFSAVLRDATAAAGARKARAAHGTLDKVLVSLLYAEKFFFMDDAKHVPAVYGAAAGRADGEAGQLVALLLSTL